MDNELTELKELKDRLAGIGFNCAGNLREADRRSARVHGGGMPAGTIKGIEDGLAQCDVAINNAVGIMDILAVYGKLDGVFSQLSEIDIIIAMSDGNRPPRGDRFRWLINERLGDGQKTIGGIRKQMNRLWIDLVNTAGLWEKNKTMEGRLEVAEVTGRVSALEKISNHILGQKDE